ncbi:MAG: hypothetical protein ACXADU_06770 [Promethearchaeota archaeon]|jgi:hypothetical protein
MKQKTYRYLDGNGNEYIIEGEPTTSIEYNPVKTHYSSSGIYDGGEHKKRQITNQQYNEVTTILDKIIVKKENQMKDRVKMSGMIIIQKKTKQKGYVFKPHSKEIDVIEEHLNNLLRD